MMRPKSTLVAFVLWLPGLVGFCGLHRLYLGLTGTGIVWLFTLGVLGLGQLIDLFGLGSLVRAANSYRFGGTAVPNVNTNTVAPIINVTVAAPYPAAPVTLIAPVAGPSVPASMTTRDGRG
jgi:TM2 domain-containing membrane protein YozV